MSSSNWWQDDSDASRQEPDGPPPPPAAANQLNAEWAWSKPDDDGPSRRTATARPGALDGAPLRRGLPVTGPISALRVGVDNVTNYQGRATRQEFWWLWLMLLMIQFAAMFSIEFLFLTGPLTASAAELAEIGVLLGSFAIMLPAAVRRLHDSGQAGWWAIVPLVNLILLLMPSDPTTNRFGPPR